MRVGQPILQQGGDEECWISGPGERMRGKQHSAALLNTKTRTDALRKPHMFAPTKMHEACGMLVSFLQHRECVLSAYRRQRRTCLLRRLAL
eukprot:CAMPEP_0196665594 /NCGR_PEP_ID=MMETSP1086-20130531/61690_1 /TAXON_ID=77921 /ORGANISM="Cyanoptyche  gloeocystis , Strain SAG4.97" /LENGTH=90 /DNA_ID=CAMNT_0042002425 /DNA_START=1 /DNA_END=270 /DNA_ORIENTATION=-